MGPESVIQISAVSSIVGAWVGAIPIPLDWDRDWQVLVALCYTCIKLSVLKINRFQREIERVKHKMLVEYI